MRVWPSLSRLLSGGLFAWAAASLSVTGTPACQLQTANSGQVPCPPNADGTPGTCQVTLTLLHTADIHSRLLPYDLLITQVDGNLGLGTIGATANVGGAARMGYVLKRERAKSDRVLHISGGDVFEGAPIFNFFSGEPEMRTQAALQVDVAVLANHEFDRGANNVERQIQKWADFPVLAANYIFTNPATASSNSLDGVIHPFTVLDAGGLKVAVIGMANLSSLTSIFNTPNSFGIKPLNSVEVVQFYVDLLRPLADVIVIDSHLGLNVDQEVITQTTGVDVWMGSHNHIVIDPPEQISDCSANPQEPGYIWVMDPNIIINENLPPPNDALHPDPINHPYEIHRLCTPRSVILSHSGAFAKYVGRLDLVLSNDPSQIIASRVISTVDAGTGTPDGGTVIPVYDPVDHFEVLSSQYQVFPITDAVPEDPVVKQMLEPYQIQLQKLSDLTTVAGFSPNGAKRTAPANGDSPLGNLIAAANWLRLGVQTDFALTNTTGIRQDLLPGPVTIDEAYDIFPFDNTITTMYLSGTEIYELYDFVARRSGSRGCVSQAQIAGSRVVLNCAGCTRITDAQGNVNIDTCYQDADCPSIETLGTCDKTRPLVLDKNGNPVGYPCLYTACADDVYVGFNSPALPPGQTCATAPATPGCCLADADCGKDNSGNTLYPNSCSKEANGVAGVCMTPVVDTNVYELSTSNYLAAGGSGFRVLQRNTTQKNTGINQRDAMIDYIRQGPPCGWQDANKPSAWQLPAGISTLPPDGLTPCQTDNDCAPVSTGGFVCACAGSSAVTGSGSSLTCSSGGSCTPNANGNDQFGGRCVPAACRDQVAEYRATRCTGSLAPDCIAEISPCDAASQICQIVACVDATLNAVTDSRIQMTGK